MLDVKSIYQFAVYFEEAFTKQKVLNEDVMKFSLKTKKIDHDKSESIITVSAELYFETSSKTDKEAKKICESSDFKKELKALLTKYF